MKTWKIYAIKYRATDDVAYIGLTAHSVKRRWSEHKAFAKRSGKAKLQNAIRNVGSDAFYVEQVATCSNHENACATEIALIAHYDTYRYGLNSTIGGEGAHGVSKIVTNEERSAISQRNRERWADPEKRAEICMNMRSPRSPEFGKAISERRTGMKLSDETRAKMSKSRIGMKHSPEVRAKIAAKNIARNKSPEHRAKVAAARLLKKQHNIRILEAAE